MSIRALRRGLFAGCAALLATVLQLSTAHACGCFVPPDPSVPIVQAGERILFGVDNGEVTAHIQIQYAGNAGEFGWLLPLPAIPMLEVGSDELFAQLINRTQPRYAIDTRNYEGHCTFDPSRSFGRSIGGGVLSAAQSEDGAGGSSTVTGPRYNPLVLTDSVGPYDYAVLKADRKDEMLAWLEENRYFVPAGTDETVGPYIHPGAFFLALKLKTGSSTGDLQPVVLRYKSDLPMIPIVLTSVAAQPDMGIQVFMLGPGRAIPRNYYHTVINDSQIDWIGAGRNYNDVIIRATKEAPERHTFVTEFAGSASKMRNVLNAPGRFGDPETLRSIVDPKQYVRALFQQGFGVASTSTDPSGFGQTTQLLPPTLVAILSRSIIPPAGEDPGLYFRELGGLAYDSARNGRSDVDAAAFDPIALTDEIQERIVTPTLAAGELFDRFPYLSRLYTTLSPENMSRDPVFSYNVGLPDYGNDHSATLTYHCGLLSDDPKTTAATVETPQGWQLRYPDGTGEDPFTFSADVIETALPEGPATLRLESMSEQSVDVVRNNERIIAEVVGAGCSVGTGAGASDPAGLIVAGLALLGLVAVRRRRSKEASGAAT